ncbi:sugar transferase [Botrimarina sp.]|uniref:sugar transferase n=1 Tax=Botrimarina sp. TaxID=2795802 RepID=UPI0032EEFE29
MTTSSLVAPKAIAANDHEPTPASQARLPEHTIEVPAYLRRKRIAVRVLGAILAVVLLPVILVLIAVVRLTSPGPGLYRQRRLGLNGEEFTIYKLRSMRVDAEATTGPVWSAKGDARVTLIGKLLRYFHLDELPQVFNIVRGEMDFVGPRPERPEIAARLERILPSYSQRLFALPGVTGVAQVNLPPDETLDCVRRKLAADLYYIENASAWLDLRLMLATALRFCGIRYFRGAKLLGVQYVPPVPASESDDPRYRVDSALDDTGEFVSIGETIVDAHRPLAVASACGGPRRPR